MLMVLVQLLCSNYVLLPIIHSSMVMPGMLQESGIVSIYTLQSQSHRLVSSFLWITGFHAR